MLLYKMALSIVYVHLNESRVGEGPFYFFSRAVPFLLAGLGNGRGPEGVALFTFFCLLYMKTNLAKVNFL